MPISKKDHAIMCTENKTNPSKENSTLFLSNHYVVLFFPAASLDLKITDQFVRVRFSGLGQDSQEEPNSRKRRLSSQKTQSFKGERKKAQNWFLRLFSGQTSRDGGEFATSIAAAAFAINSLEEAESQNQKKMSEVPLTSLTKLKSRKEDSTSRLSDTGRVSRRFPGQGEKENTQYPGEASMKKREGQERVLESASIKKKLSFDDQYLNGTRMKPEHGVDTGRPNLLSTRTRSAETKADAWEKAEMAKIKKWYEKMNSTIHTWENAKKVKARRRMDRIESELEKRKGRALQNYNIDIARIDQIAGGARAQAEERRKNEEFKAKEKANKIRSTGKEPTTCFCF